MILRTELRGASMRVGQCLLEVGDGRVRIVPAQKQPSALVVEVGVLRIELEREVALLCFLMSGAMSCPFLAPKCSLRARKIAIYPWKRTICC